MNSSTTVAATIGVGALGVLAYYGYQNLGGKTDDVKVGELYNDIDNSKSTKEKEEKDLQTQAKEEVAKAVENATNAWGSFWNKEYNSMNSVDHETNSVLNPLEVPKVIMKEEEPATEQKDAGQEADSSDYN